MADKDFDKNKLSFFNTDDIDQQVWIGLKFQKPIPITKIRYLCRNDMNTIEVDDKYESLLLG